MDKVLLQAPVFLLIFVRCFGMIMTLPLFSMRSISRIAKVALAGYMAFFIFGASDLSFYLDALNDEGTSSMIYFLYLVGEGLIGITFGFLITLMFSAFSSAGQFVAFQMGFGAASAYDSLSQIENPLMGQFFNLMAMLVFMQTKWFQKLFLGVLSTSFQTVNIFNMVEQRQTVINFLLKGLTNLFADALIISLPVMGTLLLITLCTGLLTKAAPQMNLLSEGFPIMILVAFYVIFTFIPGLTDFFVRSFSSGFADIQNLFIQLSGGIK